ncbi:hypothetical protein [Paenibacillus sp. RC67]|uniref:hypothetical protein n=1 Tax=Paenibacillus sp. RC67 TaxID=3039392 RepID=UPI0024ADC26C|nr:hypothetical protein [Paenibacillus sp. RC67]
MTKTDDGAAEAGSEIANEDNTVRTNNKQMETFFSRSFVKPGRMLTLSAWFINLFILFENIVLFSLLLKI